MEKTRQEIAEEQAKYASALQEQGYVQEKDADLQGIELIGRHMLFKAPDIKPEEHNGIVLLEETAKKLQSVGDTPGFKDNLIVALASDECNKVRAGHNFLLSPHVQNLEITLPANDGSGDKVLYLLVHEDYVLAVREAEAHKKAMDEMHKHIPVDNLPSDEVKEGIGVPITELQTQSDVQ